uniref:Uncharacterized protein n=1 Tax=Oryza punctata TaxID=4537 RepID=A0A0E0MGI9_ORYPU
MATPPPPAVRPGEGAAARALTSLSSWLAWVKRGAYGWLASAALRLSSWREGAFASTAAKASGEEAINKPSGKKGIKKLLRTKRSNGDFPVDMRPQRRHHDDYDLVQPQLYSRSFAADRKSPRVDPSENRDKIMHLSFKEANEKCKKNHTLCLACFMANFGSKSPVRPRDIHNDNMGFVSRRRSEVLWLPCRDRERNLRWPPPKDKSLSTRLELELYDLLVLEVEEETRQRPSRSGRLGKVAEVGEDPRIATVYLSSSSAASLRRS